MNEYSIRVSMSNNSYKSLNRRFGNSNDDGVAGNSYYLTKMKSV